MRGLVSVFCLDMVWGAFIAAPASSVASDPKQFAQALYAAGYSTDPAYADNLTALMDSYDLYRLDA